MILEGLRLIHMAYNVPTGTTAAHLLADMGMDVIDVESPTGGRGGGQAKNERARAFDSQNRNKRSIVLDLKEPAHQDAFYRLAKTADALLECYRPGVAKRLAIDYETIHKINPELVYCSLTGYGQTGPYRSYGLHDWESTLNRGVFSRGEDGEPLVPAKGILLLSDMGGGLHAALGILAALLGRNRTGQGSYVDVAITDSISTFNLTSLERAFAGAPEHRYEGTILGYAVLRCSDGWIVQNDVEPANWARFCQAIGRPEYSNFLEVDEATRARYFVGIREVMLTKTRAEWFRLIAEAGATASIVQSADEVVDDPQVRARGLVWELDHPTEGRIRHWGAPIQFAGEPAKLTRFAPRPGEHSAEILASLGYSASEIERIVGPSQPRPQDLQRAGER